MSEEPVVNEAEPAEEPQLPPVPREEAVRWVAHWLRRQGVPPGFADSFVSVSEEHGEVQDELLIFFIRTHRPREITLEKWEWWCDEYAKACRDTEDEYQKYREAQDAQTALRPPE